MVVFSNNSGVKRGVLALAILVSFAESVTAQEMANLETALNTAVLHTGYYVSLENLNDLAQTNTIRPYDSIQDQTGVYVIIPEIGTFSGRRRNLAIAFNQWQGPYANYQAGHIQEGTTPYDQGSPLDPWGQPYYFFNPLGLLRGDQGIITQELYGDQFDRYTIVSLGPDGVMSGDDITRAVGAGITISGTHLTSLRGTTVTLTSPPQAAPPTYDVAAGTTLTLRGINFGPPAENKHVIFGETVLQDVESWTSREVTVRVPETLAGTEEFALQIGTQTTNRITATITGSHTRVEDWAAY